MFDNFGYNYGFGKHRSTRDFQTKSPLKGPPTAGQPGWGWRWVDTTSRFRGKGKSHQPGFPPPPGGPPIPPHAHPDLPKTPKAPPAMAKAKAVVAKVKAKAKAVVAKVKAKAKAPPKAPAVAKAKAVRTQADKERDYLTHNPDVAKAVRLRVFPTGYAHWLRHGKREGRTFAGVRPGYLAGVFANWDYAF